MTKRDSRCVLLICMAVVSGLALILWLGMHRSQFNFERWTALKGQRSPLSWGKTRWAMMSDLRSNHLPVGKPRTEVLQLLGEPEIDDSYRRELWYDLGSHGLFDGNTRELVLSFSEDDKLETVSVLTGE
jgi:hypothetical protein